MSAQRWKQELAYIATLTATRAPHAKQYCVCQRNAAWRAGHYEVASQIQAAINHLGHV
jgi:hypothetical protein